MATATKNYVEKSVQTLHIGASASSSTSTRYHSGPTLQCDEPKGICETQLDPCYENDSNEEGTDCAAYTHSSSPSLQSYDEPACLHLRPSKPAQLPYRLPSNSSIQSQRAVSFPNSAVPRRPSDEDLNLPASSLRAVSLPGLESRHFDSNSLQGNISSFEDSDSFETSYHSSGTGSITDLVTRSAVPSDIPATPSPPCSPGSVMLHDDYTGSYRELFHLCRIPSTKTCEEEDDTGWITWSNSPPRPIPALHGPLSLPYARCPSGAEGTIIEDADLPRMIWGLDMEDSHLNSGRERPEGNSVQPLPIQQNSALLPPDDRQPTVKRFDDRTHLYMNLQQKEATSGRGHSHPPAGPAAERAMQEDTLTRPVAWDDPPIDIHRLIPSEKYFPNEPAIGSSQFKLKKSELASTGSFKPALVRASIASPTPRIFVEPRTGSQIITGPRLTAIEIAKKYQAERQHTALFDMHTTSIPLPGCSPELSHVRTLTQDTTVTNSRHRQCNHHALVDSGTSKFPSIASDKETSSTTYLRSRVRDKVSSPSINGAAIVSNSAQFHPSVILRNPCSRPVFYENSQPELNSPNIPQRQSTTRQSPSSLLQTSRLQSIPMTRLMQRRLSSVAEEDLIISGTPNGSNTNLQSARLDNNDVVDSRNAIQQSRPRTPDFAAESIHHMSVGKENAIEPPKSRDKGTIKKKWRSRRKAVAPLATDNQ